MEDRPVALQVIADLVEFRLDGQRTAVIHEPPSFVDLHRGQAAVERVRLGKGSRDVDVARGIDKRPRPLALYGRQSFDEGRDGIEARCDDHFAGRVDDAPEIILLHGDERLGRR